MHERIALGTVKPLVVPELVTLPAEIDISNADEVAETIRAAWWPGTTVVIADLSNTVFCDSTGACELLKATECAEAANAQLRLVISNGLILKILAVLGFDRRLHIYPTVTAALSGSLPPEP